MQGKKVDPFEDALQSLKAAQAKAQRQLDSINRAIAELSGEDPIPNQESVKSSISSPVNDPDYDSKWSIGDKFLYFLKKEDRFLHFREAAEFIAEREGGDVDEIRKKLSTRTIQLKKSGIITKYKVGNQNANTFWGSSKWLDENGEIKPGHEYNEEYLRSGGRPKGTPLFDI